MNIRKMTYLNCGERYEDLIDHGSYTRNLAKKRLISKTGHVAFLVKNSIRIYQGLKMKQRITKIRNMTNQHSLRHT